MSQNKTFLFQVFFLRYFVRVMKSRLTHKIGTESEMVALTITDHVAQKLLKSFVAGIWTTGETSWMILVESHGDRMLTEA
jgi:hypothetical protein